MELPWLELVLFPPETAMDAVALGAELPVGPAPPPEPVALWDEDSKIDEEVDE